MNDIHFRYTSKNNPWKTLRSYYDGGESINVSIGKLKGMSMKDSENTYMPSFVYGDFKNAINTRNIYKESTEKDNPNYMYLIYNDGVSDSLQVQELLTYSKFVKLDAFKRLTGYKYSPEIYYYENPYGFSYISYNNRNMLYGNGRIKFGLDDELSLRDWRYINYLKIINLAYIDDAKTISYNVFRLNETFQDRDIERFTNSIGIFHSRIKDGYSFTSLPTFDEIDYNSKYFDVSTSEARTSLITKFNQFIFNGLYVTLKTPISNDDINNIDINGSGCLSLPSYNKGSRIKSIYGRLDIDNDVDVLANITTGSRKVSISNITNGNKLKLYNSSFVVSTDIEKDDISYPLSKLAEDYNKDALICVDTRLKSIRKDRGDLISDSIYSKDVDYICGYNNMTGKHVCIADIETQIIDLPAYTNAAGMDVIGLTNYCKGVITSSSVPYLQYPTSNSSIPFINFNPQDYYKLQDTYSTKESAIDYVTENNIEKYSILHNGKVDKYYLYIKDENMWCRENGYTCFEFVSDNAVQDSSASWSNSTYSDKSRQINASDLHGLDNGRFVAYIKFDSKINYDLFLMKNGTVDENYLWHFHFYLNTYDSTDAAQCSINIPPNGDLKRKNLIYTYNIDDEGNYNYTSSLNYAEFDKIYALIINPTAVTTKCNEYTGTPRLVLCDIANEDGSIKEEHLPYLDSSKCNRNCVKMGVIYMFSITYLGKRYEWSIDEDKLSTYFDITYSEDDATEITSLSFKLNMINTLKTDDTVNGSKAFVTPAESDGDICVNIDENMKTNNIFNSSNPICIPQYSGCVFVKYTNNE